jgi:hypothetical protein
MSWLTDSEGLLFVLQGSLPEMYNTLKISQTMGSVQRTWADHLIPGLIFFRGNYNT